MGQNKLPKWAKISCQSQLGRHISLRWAKEVLSCSEPIASRVLADLERKGFITTINGHFEPSLQGSALAQATAARPLLRATAERLVSEAIERAKLINADDEWAYRVPKLVLFGSLLGDWAKKHGVTVSKLCYADKLAFVLTPGWLYLPMARATGELAEYMAKSRVRQAGCAAFTETERARLESGDPDLWLQGLQSYTKRWVAQHRDGGADTWTIARGNPPERAWIQTE